MRNAAQAWASTVCGVARGDMFISRWCSGDSGGGGGGGDIDGCVGVDVVGGGVFGGDGGSDSVVFAVVGGGVDEFVLGKLLL